MGMGVVVLVVIVKILVRVRMVAVNDVRGHDLVQKPRYTLDANEPGDKAAHHDEAGVRLIPFAFLEIVL